MSKINFTLFVAMLILMLIMLKSLQLGDFSKRQNQSGQQSENDTKKVTVQELENFSYYFMDAGKPQLFIEGTKGLLPSVSSQPLSVDKPEGMAYANEEKVYRYTAEFAELWPDENKIQLSKNVVLLSDFDDLRGEQATYWAEKKYFFIQGKVQAIHRDPEMGQEIYSDSDEAEAYLNSEHYIFRGNVQGKILRARAYESPIFYRSSQADAQLQQNMIYLQGPVWAKQNRFEAEGLRGEIFLENYNKSLKYYGLYDDVRLRQFPLIKGKGPVKFAQGEKLDGFMAEKKVVLTGNPRLLQGESKVKGTEITFFENSDVVEAVNADSQINL